MTFGFRARNGNDQITIDENHIGYVHLLTTAIPTQTGGDRGGYANITFTCAGFPLVFFDVPYNITAQDTGASNSLLKYRTRTGIALIKLVNNGSNSWTATFMVNNYNGPNLNLYMRVFGRANLNYPNGSGMAYGFKVRDPDGNLVFDAGLPMLRLGGDTYDKEMVLDWRTPGQGGLTEAASAYDSAVDMGVSMQNKSICATSRGLVYRAFPVSNTSGNFEYYIYHYASLYWANGSTLYARRIAIDFDYMEGDTNYTIDNSTAEMVYSRIAVLNNSHWSGGSGGSGGGTGSPPVITQQPAFTSQMHEGDTATFSLTATGAVSYQWKKNDLNVASNGNSATYSFVVGADDNDGDQYNCHVTNNYGVTISSYAALNKYTGVTNVPPVITVAPQDVTVVQNGSASMTGDATGQTYVGWLRDGSYIFGSTVYTLSLNTATVGTFTYTFRAYNGTGYSDATATLTVTAPSATAPVISTQPSDQTTTVGTAVSMTCVGSPVTGYQWRINGSNVSGATSSTFYPDVSVAGLYSITCAVSNSSATTISNTAYLTVNAASGGGGSGEFATYQNLVYREDLATDASVAVSVSKDEGWGIGTGDPTLYSVRATGTGNTSAIDSGTQQLNVWYSFASYDSPQWTLNPPFTGNGSTYSVTLSFQIKLNSTGAVVSNGSGLLSATFSGE